MGLRKSTGVWEGWVPALEHHRCWGAGVAAGTLERSQMNTLGRKVSQGFPHSRVHKGFSLQAREGLSPSADGNGNRALFSGIVKSFIFLSPLLPLTASILTQ